MDATELTRDLEILWLWIAAPLVLVAALASTIFLRAPQLTKLAEAFRALRSDDAKAKGRLHPASSVALAAAASYGAAGAVGAATAVSLGGAGAVAWVWLFAILIAPLRMAETLLARTAPPGQAGKASGSLAGRLLTEGGAAAGLGWALLVLVPLAGLAFYGGTHGEAVMEAADQLLPGSALALGLAVAAVAAVLSLAPLDRAGSILGWIAAVALIAFFGVALTAVLAEPGRAFGGFGRALMDAIYDAPSLRAFSGATAGEIAFAAVLYVLPPVAAPAGVDGALEAEARGATKKQAAAALLAPLFFGVLTTLLGLSFVGTSTFAREVEGERPLSELTIYRVGFATVSQRNEEDRLFTGILRVVDGSLGVLETELGTERGMVRAPRFEDRGEPGDFMLRVHDGHVVELQRRGELGALERQPLSDIADIQVKGRMLPRGGRLLAQGMVRGGGEILARLGLAALLLLAALGGAAWGLGVASTLRARLPERIARFTAVVPALGLALAALGVIPGFGMLGSAIAALLVSVGAIAILARVRQAARIAR